MNNKKTENSQTDKNGKMYKIVVGKGVMNLPNKLTLSRVIMIPLFVLFFYLNFIGHYFVALAIFVIASLTDFLDGYLARKYSLVTNLGKFLDPIADKVLVSTAMIIMLTTPEVFTANLGEWGLIAAGCGVALILVREMIVSGFRMVAASSGLVIAADKIGKYKTTVQDLAVVLLLIGMALAELCTGINQSDHSLYIVAQIANYVGLGLFAVAIVLTVWSGINYIVKNRHVLKV